MPLVHCVVYEKYKGAYCPACKDYKSKSKKKSVVVPVKKAERRNSQ